ncbi:hypothetical protein PRUPE_8G043200 [Prunus persica]|uniref:Uncharacterized protein n=1 Tax=Prunus persica TaxID=3760 RepID=M5VNQ0_PRUPE|nr:uncharacterized protein LOC18768852 [Prunus persica]ONH90262.1 hypothetical protein PRUPE_8G043200 [Prunus persica]
MARHLLLTHPVPSAFQVGLAAMTLAFCAMALLMCASHSRKWRRHWNACTDFFEDDPVIEHIQPGNYDAGMEDTNSGELEDSVWQKNILMGGKCQLPDFSGVIIYDSDGNIVKPDKTPRLTWK